MNRPEKRSVCEVVVHELPPLHHVVGVQLARGVHVGHDVDADEAGGGQTAPCPGRLGPPHPVTVGGQQRALEGRVGRAPQRLLQVVAGAVSCAEGVVRLARAAAGALVPDQRLLDAEVVEAEGCLVRGQGEALAQVLGAADADHGVIRHLPRLGLRLEECEVVEGG